MGTAGSVAVGKDPKVEPPCVALVAKFRSPNLENTDPAVVDFVVVELVFVDVVSCDDVVTSFFTSEEEGGVKVAEAEEVVVVSDVFSSGFDSPKVKPPLEELLSVLDDPVPNTIPPLTPNLNPAPAAGWSDFLSSPGPPPNELPNLKPDEAVVSLEVVSDEELPNGSPNLNPPDEEEDVDSEDEVPNLKPPEPDPAVLSDVPNLKPPVLEVEEPKVEDPEVPPAEEPKEPKAEEKQKMTNIYRHEKIGADCEGVKQS